ncbi:NADH/NAD(+) kinase KNAG_0G00470 [Huiozyma naganishii CBS 8797]|uniref:NAD+ kinase n=1 Tax=Huiozyma naganishii (strain ATCC MYA-139 / BCRC 22969 / CBS 8797 / KCTC 17520 / NBRC 10181 / NCYC 3082 / Yp74L-3) TaxID=1071383 RepID=J7S7Q6_HUIN7|nr:hypothetical protein KNAG_0G00470 [Kazachstania naganishii CBS 8797]CCK71104.1 hypothetical protein KNAG_0G00470 [Kazachstania naganishii CBS 8797]
MDKIGDCTSADSSKSLLPDDGAKKLGDRLNALRLGDHPIAKSVPSFSIDCELAAGDDGEQSLQNLADLMEAKKNIRKLSSNAGSERSLTSTKSHVEIANTAYGLRLLSKNISNTKVSLEVEKMIVIAKNTDMSMIYLLREFVEWVLTHFPYMTIYVEDIYEHSTKFAGKEICADSDCKTSKIKYWNEEFVREQDVFFDLCVTMGGDGTVLFASTLFQKHVPPVLPFSLGSLGFLTNFDFGQFKQDLPVILNKKIKTNLRMRLECKVYRKRTITRCLETGKKKRVMELASEHHVLNEVTIDRGPSPYLSMLELYGDDSLMTVAQADGLIVATPTGSTAYSLSAGGSLMYPSVNAIAVTPVCPHTLSFRPIVLPDSIKLKVKVPANSRGSAWVAFDGKSRIELQRGDYVIMCSSPYVFPTVESSPTEFIDGIHRTMNWNVRDEQKTFEHILSRKNRERFVTEMDDESDDSSVEEMIVENGVPLLDGKVSHLDLIGESSSSEDRDDMQMSSHPREIADMRAVRE